MTQLSIIVPSTFIKREPVEQASTLNADDRIAFNQGATIAVKNLRFHPTSNHWEFELDQVGSASARYGKWYAYKPHAVPDDSFIPDTEQPNIRFSSGRFRAKQATFLKRTPDQQAGTLSSLDKIPLQANQTIQAIQIVGVVPGKEGNHWCFKLDGKLAGKERRGFWYAWEPHVTFSPAITRAATEDGESENLIVS